ncbi:hypothetical protein [Budvicia diplopodorum]|uniref:hypothetical protein n=1 Tax=Budvicia diplopodorum TaxID=1119056 RepID=UPI001358EA27|nr:hypothetical protein [Budvicia diplopodorum]
MRDLSQNEIEMVSGSGSQSNLGQTQKSTVSWVYVSNVEGDFAKQFEYILKAIGDAFIKIGGILNYYSNLFTLPGSPK